ncbi:GIY-YIG nuclease family protein [Xenorhabdus sp. BG5]|uniref:GIY-YIG nuclease family protein n=1 Tax=Xenorhabdus sp. BG5 TaxID=2782014 RepID=UPI00187F781F|nr:GIY-YIG nuclease family protein [Xenorhabdus sp. BG5]MBE8597408.1 GIY-YIG nuclease family protein [Xenorhabdus sp. BG5]
MIRLSTQRLSSRINLDDIFSESDDLGLLNVQPLKARQNVTNISEAQFAEINAFYKEHGRQPAENSSASLNEKILARRLHSLRSSAEQSQHLQRLDEFGLLKNSDMEEVVIFHAAETSANYLNRAELVTSLDDIFADDDGLLDFDTPDIFTLKHIQVEKKEQPAEIAQRQPCPDFVRYEPIFKRVQNDLQSGHLGTERFSHKLKINTGDFFILNGLMGYVASIGERLEQYSSYNARLHLVFENGTEMHMLYLSLTHGLVRDKEGRKLKLSGEIIKPSEEAIPTGLVYILATSSVDPVLAPYKHNLYKVGFTESTVENRIKNAEKDQTFLQAPVRIVSTSQCFNLNAHKLETLIHGFLAPRRLNVTLKSHTGQIYIPREWFYVPLSTVLAVIEHVVNGTISQYRLDNTTGRIVQKK